ncbi:MAG: glycosyl transferase family 2, partial [Clostridia bacterium]
LSLPTSLWDEERSAAMRFIARSYKAKEDFYNAKNWLHKAIAETPNLREPYIDLAIIAHLEKDWVSMYYYSSFALRIKEKHLGYVNEIYAWNFNPYDLVAISAYWLGLKNIAIENSEIAMKLSPDNSRLINNHKYYVDINNYPKPLLN